jgi:hypothetical protein
MSDKRVVVLGAGFSKAAAGVPIVSDVSKYIEGLFATDLMLQKLKELSPSRKRSESFEQWLSRLAEPDVWLSETEKRASRSMVEEVTERSVRHIFEQQHSSDPFDDETGTEVHPIAESAAKLFFVDQLVEGVVSLNYDTVLERAHARFQVRELGETYPKPRLNPYQIPHRCFDGSQGQVPLLKLHGSTHWFKNRTGEDIFDVGFSAGGCEEDDSSLWWDHQQIHCPGYSRLIVPPVAVKRDYLNLPVLVRQWQIASKLLKAATEVVVIGYSVPAEDSMVLSLLGEASDATFTVVNRSVGDPRDQLSKHGCKVGRDFSGNDCVAEYLAHLGA